MTPRRPFLPLKSGKSLKTLLLTTVIVLSSFRRSITVRISLSADKERQSPRLPKFFACGHL